jgi:hypothetical protein
MGSKQKSFVFLGAGSNNVRFGSKADICSAKGDVRFTPESGHQPTGAVRLDRKQSVAVLVACPF